MRSHKKNTALLFIIILLLGLISISSQARWTPKQNTSPFDLYDHDKHFLRFAEFDVDCTMCHQTDDSYSREKVNKMGCHHCHNNSKSPSPKAKKYKCITCHKDLSKVKPDNHKLSWISRHQTIAKQDKRSCLKCHKGFFCTDCHQKRDFNNKRNHSRLFRYFHSIEARSNPNSCTSCHKTSFCKDCHVSNN
jgi:hypothetical protein